MPHLLARSATVVLVASVIAPVAPMPGAAGAGPTNRSPRGSITVSAAASLAEAFTGIATRFESRNPDVTVSLNFGSSSSLAAQVESGAPVDVFASADRTTMDRLVDTAQVRTRPVRFAGNRMAIAVKPDNPARVTGVADLARLAVVSLCGPAVPCGKYAARVLRRAGVSVPESRITRGTDAPATLAVVARGDADAAIVYATDVVAAGTVVEEVAIPAEANVTAAYLIAPTAATTRPGLAHDFVDFVVSRAGRRVLARYGFLVP